MLIDCINVYVKSFLTDKRHSKYMGLECQSHDCVLKKNFSHMNIYLYIYEEPLFQTIISEIGIGIATSILGLALNALWKRALHIRNFLSAQLKYTQSCIPYNREFSSHWSQYDL